MSDVIVGVSNAVFDHKAFKKTKCRAIYNGLDRADFLTAKKMNMPSSFLPNGKNIVILGRLDRLKNIDHAIRAFAESRKTSNNAPARLHIVGPEGNHTLLELKTLAEQLGVSRDTIFHGPSDFPIQYFHHADLALLPSAYEGLPGAALEALACGTPLVASSIEPVREIARQTKGVTIIPVSEISDWANALNTLSNYDRSEIEQSFWNSSPFTISNHTETMINLWSQK